MAKPCGVGLQITSAQPYVVQMLHEGRSAHRSGLIKPGDVLAAIDGLPTRSMSIVDITSRMLGTPGSFVRLSIFRGAQQMEIWLMRQAVKLTPLQAQQQRDFQSQQELGKRRVEQQSSRMTERSFAMSQMSFVSIDENEHASLGGERSYDPTSISKQFSVYSEVSFDPESSKFAAAVESERSFDPDRYLKQLSYLSEKSFDPEMLVTKLSGERSYDPDIDRESLYSQASFDPDRMGFMSEKSFDPESEAFRQMSITRSRVAAIATSSLTFARKSFDPESAMEASQSCSVLPVQNTKREKSFDPDNFDVFPENSEMSFDPDLLSFPNKSFTSSLAESSYDPEESDERNGRKENSKSFDPEESHWNEGRKRLECRGRCEGKSENSKGS
ncbi:hypothetical protein GUITHDRAFT_164491 [Guillardia theta CCMP2712]|uniref:PDZ domain-containing protein n=1 Tax=Guillardia theta (strain CCMP2712) TaxID=905079 RepID=L1IYF6_GUITC|nr:hypothetical protein GUITHDRAFT_164491 [Guillardia theta CCMP2712]EKX41147.1 hypothetical protein GUITHDRAFT_164491 [Guillardia theta CCMP2712]|eukprot:XP_005828127.1 hypothetical protein GUITHDRAFT_164491 [Guillardia theta CCMP2712]